MILTAPKPFQEVRDAWSPASRAAPTPNRKEPPREESYGSVSSGITDTQILKHETNWAQPGWRYRCRDIQAGPPGTRGWFNSWRPNRVLGTWTAQGRQRPQGDKRHPWKSTANTTLQRGEDDGNSREHSWWRVSGNPLPCPLCKVRVKGKKPVSSQNVWMKQSSLGSLFHNLDCFGYSGHRRAVRGSTPAAKWEPWLICRNTLRGWGALCTNPPTYPWNTNLLVGMSNDRQVLKRGYLANIFSKINKGSMSP